MLAVDPNKDVEGMEMVPPPCIDIGVCILIVLVVDAMLPEVVIEGMCVCGPRLEGLCVESQHITLHPDDRKVEENSELLTALRVLPPQYYLPIERELKKELRCSSLAL